MLRHLFSALLCATLTCIAATAHADDKAPAPKMTAEQFLAKLKFEQGLIKLPDGIATLNLPDSFRYLGPADAERLLVDAWGNPPGQKTLGMIIPTAQSPLAENGWGVIVTYQKDGHVKDDDADSIKYDALLKDMQQSVLDGNS